MYNIASIPESLVVTKSCSILAQSTRLYHWGYRFTITGHIPGIFKLKLCLIWIFRGYRVFRRYFPYLYSPCVSCCINRSFYYNSYSLRLVFTSFNLRLRLFGALGHNLLFFVLIFRDSATGSSSLSNSVVVPTIQVLNP